MTSEGIIQKAFQAMIDAHMAREGGIYDTGLNHFTIEEILKLQQDLIAKIKKMKTTEGDFYDDSIYVDLKKLIGKE